jgi:hypothetical protein
MAYFTAGPIKKPPKASIIPISIPATKEPSMLPKPPNATVAKAIMAKNEPT